MTNGYRIYSKDQLPLYVFVCMLFVMGVIFGALLVNALTWEQKQDVTLYLNTFMQSYAGAGPSAAAGQPLLDVFHSHARWIVVIWLLGISVVGVPIILALDFLKGVLVGFTVGYLAGQWSWKGMLFAIASVAPQNLIAVPAIIICSVTAVSFSMLLIKNRFVARAGSVGQPFAFYSVTAVIMLGLLLGVSMFETYVSPALLEWVSPIVLEGFDL